MPASPWFSRPFPAGTIRRLRRAAPVLTILCGALAVSAGLTAARSAPAHATATPLGQVWVLATAHCSRALDATSCGVPQAVAGTPGFATLGACAAYVSKTLNKLADPHVIGACKGEIQA